MRWIQVTWGDACFGLGIDDGRVTEAPDLAKWARGQNERTVANWYRARGATFADLDGPTHHQASTSRHLDGTERWFHEKCRGTHTIAETAACEAAGEQP